MTIPPTLASKTLLLCPSERDQMVTPRKTQPAVRGRSLCRHPNLKSRLQFDPSHFDIRQRQRTSQRQSRMRNLHLLMMMRRLMMSYNDTTNDELCVNEFGNVEYHMGLKHCNRIKTNVKLRQHTHNSACLLLRRTDIPSQPFHTPPCATSLLAQPSRSTYFPTGAPVLCPFQPWLSSCVVVDETRITSTVLGTVMAQPQLS